MLSDTMIKARSGLHSSILLMAVLSFILLSQGCATVKTRNPLPQNLIDLAKIEGIPDARIWGDEIPPHYQDWKSKSREELETSMPSVVDTQHNYLAISGGGPRGAYGAGILVGWSQSQTRPEFTVVTGVSVGALTAPFAFLGADYDDELKTLYTEYYTTDLIKKRNPFTAIWRDSFASSDPLKKVITYYVNDEMVEALAIEHKRGRRLFVITTNLDASRPVIWDIGAIAVSGSSKAIDLIRDIICASASIPALMPPVYVEVEANGEYFDEMHVDGGATTQVMFSPTGVDLGLINRKLGTKGRPTIYVIRNGYFNPPYKPVEPKLLPIMAKSLASLVRAQGTSDLSRIYFSALRDDIAYKFTFIPSDVDDDPKEIGGLEYMNLLFDLGTKLGKSGEAWHITPFDVEERP